MKRIFYHAEGVPFVSTYVSQVQGRIVWNDTVLSWGASGGGGE